MSEPRTIAPAAPKSLDRIVELLPAGKVPGNFAREFCRIFRPELEARFLTPAAAAKPGSSSS